MKILIPPSHLLVLLASTSFIGALLPLLKCLGISFQALVDSKSSRTARTAVLVKIHARLASAFLWIAHPTRLEAITIKLQAARFGTFARRSIFIVVMANKSGLLDRGLLDRGFLCRRSSGPVAALFLYFVLHPDNLIRVNRLHFRFILFPQWTFPQWK